MITLRKWLKFSIIFITLTIAAVSVSAQGGTGVLGVWRDLNPTAYISPPANPPLNSVYMLNSTTGWAVGDERYTTDNIHAFPAMLHYDGSTWNLVPVPKNPTEEAEIPAGYALTSVNFGPPGQPISYDDGWAVGCGFDQNVGDPVALPPPTCTYPPAVDGQAIMNVPVALHWDGVTWSAQLNGLAGPNAGPLLSVFMVSPTDVWAVGSNPAGNGGTFWHWTGIAGLGGGWTYQGAAAAPLYSVFMVSPTEGWAVGGGPLPAGPPVVAGVGGVIYHYFGGTWTAVPSPLAPPALADATLRSVFMLSPTEGWAVGDDGTNQPNCPPATPAVWVSCGVGIILHYTGGTWTGPVSPGSAPNALRSVFMVSSTEGWAVGDLGTIVHYSGGTWTQLPVNLVPTLPEIDFDFNSVFLNSANDAWAVGTAGVIMHYDGVNWGTITSPSLTELTSISFGPPLSGLANSNDGWAVGRATPSLNPQPPAPGLNPVSEPAIFHWNGFMWTKGVAIGATNDLLSVFMVSTGDVWAVGGGGGGNPPGGETTASCAATPCPVILHYTGGSWNTITPPPGSYVLTSIFMISASEGWAVGCSGTVPQCSPIAHNLREPGGHAIILHYTVSGGVGSWAIFPLPTQPPLPPLNSVFMLGTTEGWAVGDGGTVLHYTVTGGIGTWNAVAVNDLAAAANLNSVFMLSPTSGWAVGGIPVPIPFAPPNGPVIIYWDGTHWTPISTPTVPGGPLQAAPTLNSVYCTGPDDCWTVGAPGGGIVAGAVTEGIFATIFHWDGFAWTHITLAPALLGAAYPYEVAPPTLNSVYMITRSSGWIVGSSPMVIPPPSLPENVEPGACNAPNLPSCPQAPLSTILLFSPFGGTLTATSTSTVMSTVTTSVTAITSSTTIAPVCPPNVTVTVKVVDNQGNPVSGANVVLNPPAFTPCLSAPLQGVTNSQGVVTFTLPPGSYSMSVSKNGASATQSIAVSTSGQAFTFTLPLSPGGLIPGFPLESIVAGIVLGVGALVLLRRRRRVR